jgi:hypothetical protein
VVIGQNKSPTLVSSQHGEIESQQPEMTRQTPRCVTPCKLITPAPIEACRTEKRKIGDVRSK